MPFLLFFILILILFFLSRQTTNHLFFFLRRFIKNEKTIYGLVSLIYFPGTILHELSHFFAATILFLKVREVKILPEFEKNYIKLGKVVYEKKDFVRGFLVGIAPLFGALFFFYLVYFFQLFPAKNFFLNLLFFYLIFTVSSTMFSSKQDLIDLVFIIPFFLFVGIIFYIFQIDPLILIKNSKIINNLVLFFNQVNQYLLLSVVINLLVFFGLKFLLLITK